MGDLNLELEKELRLQAFRDEIKAIKQKDVRGLLRKVTNVDELQSEEVGFWENWKSIFSSMEGFFEIFSIDNLDKERKTLNDFLISLEKFSKSLKFDKPNVSSARSEFLAWLRNLIGGISIPLEGLTSEDDWINPLEDLGRIKKAIQELKEELF